MEKMAVLAPMPSAREIAATPVKSGDGRNPLEERSNRGHARARISKSARNGPA